VINTNPSTTAHIHALCGINSLGNRDEKVVATSAGGNRHMTSLKSPSLQTIELNLGTDNVNVKVSMSPATHWNTQLLRPSSRRQCHCQLLSNHKFGNGAAYSTHCGHPRAHNHIKPHQTKPAHQPPNPTSIPPHSQGITALGRRWSNIARSPFWILSDASQSPLPRLAFHMWGLKLRMNTSHART
jgi:hypothetical protein